MPRLLVHHLSPGTLEDNKNRLDAVKARLTGLFDPKRLLKDMLWFEAMLTTFPMNEMLSECMCIPRTVLAHRLREQLWDGVEYCCLPL